MEICREEERVLSMPIPTMENDSIEIDIENDHASTSRDIPLPIFLKFADVEYEVRDGNLVRAAMTRGGHKQILKGITGSVGPGEILALMGPSGSGKTTLLKVLGGRLTGDIKGSITYNDTPYTPTLKRRCRHNKVGGALLKGVSGGERKRTSIGYEILVDPSVLFLDEPTSGLDSTSASKLLRVLQSLARVMF